MGIKYEDLTEEQILCFWNGVGSDTFLIKPAQLVFGKASIRHDFLYYLGGNENDRLEADRQFLTECLEVSGKSWYLKFMAYVYYYALRALGSRSFEYGVKAETWAEILDRIKLTRLRAYNVDKLKRSGSAFD